MSRILVLSNVSQPFLEDHGGKQRLIKLIESLSGEHDVTLLSLSWAGRSFERSTNGITHISVPVELSVVIKSKLRFTTGLSRPNKDTLTCFFSKKLKKFRSKVIELQESSDMVIVDQYPTALTIRGLGLSLPVFYSSHNCEVHLAEQLFPKGSGDIKVIEAAERFIIERASAISYCSSSDLEQMAKRFELDKPVYYIPNGCEVFPGLPPGAGRNSRDIIFIGSGHPPNSIAVERILELAPRLQEYHFIIAGSCLSTMGKLPAAPNVTMIEKVSNQEVEQLFARAHAFINPITIGSGVHLKVLKALSYGLPVVTTSVGARGFPEHERNSAMVLADEQTDLVNAVRAIGDSRVYDLLSKGAINLARQYGWERVGNDFRFAVEETLGRFKDE